MNQTLIASVLNKNVYLVNDPKVPFYISIPKNSVTISGLKIGITVNYEETTLSKIPITISNGIYEKKSNSEKLKDNQINIKKKDEYLHENNIDNNYVDYNKIKTSSNDNHGLDDINELLDDLI